jgi:hypothetical protein
MPACGDFTGRQAAGASRSRRRGEGGRHAGAGSCQAWALRDRGQNDAQGTPGAGLSCHLRRWRPYPPPEQLAAGKDRSRKSGNTRRLIERVRQPCAVPGHNPASSDVIEMSVTAKRGTIRTSPAAWRALLDR